MLKLRQRLRRGPSEDGFTLLEVIVAMMIFMMVSTGVLYTMMTLLMVNRDDRNRQVAANLAAQEIDLARDVNDIFDIDDHLTTYPDTTSTPPHPALNNDTFRVHRTARWVTSTGAVAPCGTGTGTLRYKLVEVWVEWDGMKGGDDGGVHSETYINPNERINDPTLGTLIASVTTALGEPVENVLVTADPDTGTTLTAHTDSAGCAFFLEVPEATFDVQLTAPTGTTYVDIDGVTQPRQTVTVVKATSASAPFTYDPAGTLRATYGTSTTIVPQNLATSLVSTRDTYPTATSSPTNPRSLLVSSAWTDGFAVLAGDVEGCFANDPALWTASGLKLDGERPDPVAADAGSIVDVTVPGGILNLTNMNTGNKYLAVKSVNVSGSGQPTCATSQVLRFNVASTANMSVALPYGSWDIYRGSSAGFTLNSSTKISSGYTTGGTNGSISSGTVTFDPRGVAS